MTTDLTAGLLVRLPDHWELRDAEDVRTLHERMPETIPGSDIDQARARTFVQAIQDDLLKYHATLQAVFAVTLQVPDDERRVSRLDVLDPEAEIAVGDSYELLASLALTVHGAGGAAWPEGEGWSELPADPELAGAVRRERRAGIHQLLDVPVFEVHERIEFDDGTVVVGCVRTPTIEFVEEMVPLFLSTLDSISVV